MPAASIYNDAQAKEPRWEDPAHFTLTINGIGTGAELILSPLAFKCNTKQIDENDMQQDLYQCAALRRSGWPTFVIRCNPPRSYMSSARFISDTACLFPVPADLRHRKVEAIFRVLDDSRDGRPEPTAGVRRR